jgi:small subunit ribosomal protein S3
MGQKVNPISMRLQVSKDWRSRWFAGKRDYATFLAQDLKVRDMIEKRFSTRATINKVEIERSPNLATVTIHTAKAGVVIGRGGSGAQEIKAAIDHGHACPCQHRRSKAP